MKTTARNERIVTRLIEEELRDSFIDYSMSVIVQRALPDARDGLKPVHRRILYAMYELGLFPEREHKKCATVVGDVLGKYHPHGDSAVYDTLVRMVQEFSLRYPLIDGQGNFGSIDGDSAAAYRYTEAKLASIAMELLTDIDRDTVDFAPNFDGRLQEPTALPARLPHLLLNGSDGIAVGMATKIPPHNMRELAAATDLLVRKPECSVEDLVELIDGPDFPTGGYIWGYEGIGDAYRTGRGLIEMRARMHLEEGMYGKQSLVVTELPYQVNKTRVIEQITKIVRSGRVEAITDLRDESDRDGVRLVIELKRDANLKKLIKTLFLKTQLKSTFGVIMLALVDGRPEQLDLKQALQCFVDHRLDVIRRRAVYELNKSEDRAHVLEGLLTALDQIDRVIELIRASTSPKAAADRLCAEFGLTQRQAEAILAMRLARLTQLERKKLIEELEALRSLIEELRHLVEEDAARRAVLRSELAELALRYGDDRRTEILDESEPFPLPAGESGESSLVMISRLGYAKAQVVRGSGGMSGAEAMAERDGDFVRQTFVARGSTEVLLFTARGSVFSLSVKDLPRGTRSSRGKQLSDFVELSAGDRIVSVVPVPEFDPEKYLLFVTREGQVKRTALSEYTNVRSGGIRATGLAQCRDGRPAARHQIGAGDPFRGGRDPADGESGSRGARNRRRRRRRAGGGSRAPPGCGPARDRGRRVREAGPVHGAQAPGPGRKGHGDPPGYGPGRRAGWRARRAPGRSRDVRARLGRGGAGRRGTASREVASGSLGQARGPRAARRTGRGRAPAPCLDRRPGRGASRGGRWLRIRARAGRGAGRDRVERGGPARRDHGEDARRDAGRIRALGPGRPR
ncbi:MAG: DNA topoisomerase (ATP-hydrolyzing) [Candidatus Palauibacterales bacterium]|nr:DNA topoisomerase (ATP-hydrolyzing) [Candidatus Palauibacterales bacterium]